ncbi:MAG: hypothetical protein ACRELG_30305 [Gemmataceae bacterium]
MTEAEWNNCTDPQAMLEFLRSDRGETRRKVGRRKMRLFACACLRGIWPLLRMSGSQGAVEVAEAFVDGLANEQELHRAYHAARAALADEFPHLATGPYWQSAEAAVHVAASRFSGGDHASVAHVPYSAAHAWALDRVGTGQGSERSLRVFESQQARQAIHADWLRDIFGRPFRAAPTIEPAVLAWNDRLVLKLARACYEERHLPDGVLDSARLNILADALEEAGCDIEELLGHLRSPVPHLRGCFALDLILGKT